MQVLQPTEFEFHLFHEGRLFQAYQLFGAHLYQVGHSAYTRFCVWAPNALNVELVGSFNDWDGQQHQMERVNSEIWCIVVPRNLAGHLYKYKIYTEHGPTIFKTDPFSFYSEVRPNSAGIIYNINDYQWNDQQWMKNRKRKEHIHSPISIYEVHLGSWKRTKNDRFLNYVELADELIPYVKEQGFTHIELLPVVEHPFDGSWGYQGTGYYAPTSRYGTPYDFMSFVDRCHEHGIGVILDWVPGHFCKDEHGLFRFDGSYLFEYAHLPERENDVWGTANFDLGKKEVHSFLISNLHYWLEYYHIDGFRVDAVANIIYWPNSDKGQLNEFGIGFLKKMNEFVHDYDSSVLMVAEDSTDYPQVTTPVKNGGLGFSYKWNMGWMNDILKYMETHPEQRSDFHSLVTFSLVYAFTERFILPFSHDEVVHGKKSLLDKMPGHYDDKFSQLRLLYGYMMAHPGKKLLFMGGELASFTEWSEARELDWNLLDFEKHLKLHAYLKKLLHLYKKTKPFYIQDYHNESFDWIDVHNHGQRIFSFIRKGKNPHDFVIILCNFSPNAYYTYKVGVLPGDAYKEILNSDDEQYGGLGRINKGKLDVNEGVYHGKPCYVEITVPPFSVLYLQPVKQRKERISNGQSQLRSNAASGRERKSVKLTNTKPR
ncbi:1,4-alpha-glucan branching protein GlgB [Falsibacillus albus]|uniref:1,4-alpha-glucan branching enzyme GlgB n=1 Tax=Falsibacillus albus TaxID=2478915 RepID=A0A3L7K453_9BACI|nr:1,4-alpha-glucan branching protein GlgB [Falsibacillus albus]RLQ97833.1 1,4-alpha-glucan branching protein GlgB [Falsibacillus albus]